MNEKALNKKMVQESRRERIIREFKGDLRKTAVIIAVVSVAVGMALMYLWLSWNGAIVPVQ